jgi:hypothetical protein
LPSYLNKKVAVKRKAPCARAEEIAARHDAKVNKWLSTDIIADFDAFQSGYCMQLKNHLQDQWKTITLTNVYVMLYNAGVGNPWHACHTWHAKQFLMARQSLLDLDLRASLTHAS